MTSVAEPASYEAWYHTPRGKWVGDQEFALLEKLLQAEEGSTLLDVGCGTGYFSRRFRKSGFEVTGLEPDSNMLNFARGSASEISWIKARAEELPFADDSFDYVTAVTSTCFVGVPEHAVGEMWRVAKKGIVLGLLNRHSLLYRQKRGKGSYRDARWDSCADARRWSRGLSPRPCKNLCQSAVFMPGGGNLARAIEQRLSSRLPWGSFLAVYLLK